MTTPEVPMLPDDVQAALEEHAFSETEREVGGILLGSLHHDVATVKAFIPALRATGSSTHVTFTHDVWSDVMTTVESKYPSHQIVGWYHTHPSFGLFLSEYDLFIHKNFFPDQRMVALVVDPVSAEMGWFGWSGDEIIELGRGKTGREAALETSAVETARTSNRNRARTVGLIMVVAGLAAGVFLGYTQGGQRQSLEVAETRVREQREVIENQELKIEALESARRQRESSRASKEMTSPVGTASIITIVQPGDSWWSLAHRFYALGARYPKLMKANPKVVGLDPGDRVVVPDVETSASD